jgi:MFS superfamily sulfate permease-like transporter
VQIPTGIAYANLAGFAPIDFNREMRALGFANLATKPCQG